MKRKREKHRSGPASDSPDISPHADNDALAQRFVRFAGEARAYAGPLYAALSPHIARDPELLVPRLRAVEQRQTDPPARNPHHSNERSRSLLFSVARLHTRAPTVDRPAAPVDLTNPIERRWFEALIWPEHERRLRLARAAIDGLLRDPPAIVNGDAVNVLAPRLDTVPPHTSLIVYNSAALCQGGAVDEQAIANVLLAHASRRPVHWLHCEGEEVRLRALNEGRMVETKLANKDGHGRWLEWLRS